MSATPSTPTPAGDDRNLVAVDATTVLTFEDKVNLFWKKHRNLVFALCGLVLLGILAREGWKYMAAKKELEIEKAYAGASTPEQLKSFAAAHPDHSLGGIAQLRIADEAYKAGKAADAIPAYEKAAAALKRGPLGARAQLGVALAKVQAGKGAEGAADLKKIADDAGQVKAVRSEAAYHVTSLAVEAGNATEAQKYVDSLMQLDPSGTWTQRAVQRRATLPAAATPVDAKKDAAAPVLDTKMPAKK